jgi:ZipA, C-terminal FtsZ-binding domain
MISDFQLVLFGIIAVIVVGVIVYNRWQETKYRRRAEQAFARDGDNTDALFSAHSEKKIDGSHDTTRDNARVEPSFGRLSAAAAEEAALDDLTAPIGGVASVDLPIEETAPRTIFRGATADLHPAINGEIDTVAMILADAPVEADRYAPMVIESQKIAKHILWEGLVGGLWQPIDPTLDEKYRELRAGLQLADRSGAIDAETLAKFDQAMADFAASLNAVSQREDVVEAARRAQMVDQFCADSDIEIAVNIIGKSGVTFAATKVRGLAEAKGLTALPNGEYAEKDDYGRILYTLRNGNQAESTALRSDQPYFTQLTFALDVPRTPNAGQIFERMFTVALQFADVLQGDVVDDNKKILTAHGRKVIADTIHEITGDMQQKDVMPGSSVALRLYS